MTSDPGPDTATERVWDPLVRLVHWSLVGAYATAFATRTQGYDLHLTAGYWVLGLVLARVVWGFVGTRHARFSDFVRGPRAVADHLRAIARGQAPRHLGHNPAGGAMIVALLATLLVLAVSGVALDAAENRAGPLARLDLFLHADLIAGVHEATTWASLGLVICHVAGVAIMSAIHRENLAGAMIGGRKRIP